MKATGRIVFQHQVVSFVRPNTHNGLRYFEVDSRIGPLDDEQLTFLDLERLHGKAAGPFLGKLRMLKILDGSPAIHGTAFACLTEFFVL